MSNAGSGAAERTIAAEAGRVLAVVVTLKLLALLADATIRLYLGDSQAYLDGARTSSLLPPHRSFVYALLIRMLVVPFGSLTALLAWQTLAGIAVAMLSWFSLRRLFNVPARAALLSASVLALEPAQILYERMIMAETFGLLAFVLFFVAGAVYLTTGRLVWLIGAAVFGLVAAILRLNYLPVVLVLSLLLPWLRALDPTRAPRWRLVAAHVLVAVLAVGGVHSLYRNVVGAIFAVEPGYLPRTGFMRMGLVAPLIRPEHFVEVRLPADFAARLKYDLRDPDRRTSHMWQPGGLAFALRAEGRSLEEDCERLSARAIEDDPAGVVRLGWHAFTNFFRPIGRNEVYADIGQRRYPPELIGEVRTYWNYDITDLAFRMTPATWYFVGTRDWLVLALLATAGGALVAAWVGWRTPRRPVVLLAALTGLGLVLSHLLFVNMASYRYLHPFPWAALLLLVPLATSRGEGGTGAGRDAALQR